MIPRAAFIHKGSPVQVAPPKHDTRYLLVDKAFGGIDVQDASRGIDYQLWTARYSPTTGTIILTSEDGKVRPILTLHGIAEIGLAFDNNSNWVLAYRLTDKRAFVSFYWDAALGRVFQPIGSCSSLMISIDDMRGSSIGITDILISYIDRNRELVVRGQREKYLKANKLGIFIPEGQELGNFGAASNGRLQWVTTNQKIRAFP